MQKIAIVTGAAKRIGKEIALSLAKHGWNVVVHYNTSATEAMDLAQEINKTSKAIAVQLDLEELGKIEEFFQTIIAKLGAPTLLVNNASIFYRDDIDMPFDVSLSKHMKINCLAPVLLSYQFAKCGGLNIVNIIDAFKLPGPFFAYTLSKKSLLVATKDLARKLAPAVRVSAISPGIVLKSSWQSDAAFERMLHAHTLSLTPISKICKRLLRIVNTPSVSGKNFTI